jgi:hypothetical protein
VSMFRKVEFCIVVVTSRLCRHWYTQLFMCERELILDGVKTRLRLILPLVRHETVRHVVRPQVSVCLF